MPGPGASPAAAAPRLTSIDLMRGLVIAFMVLDHVRDFLHVDALRFDPLDPAHTSALLYATRWITNFCAPTFVFLAGTSAWLQRARGRSTRELSLLLLTRGLWLVLLELTVLGFGWSFWIPYLLFLQVHLGDRLLHGGARGLRVAAAHRGARARRAHPRGAQPAGPPHARAVRAVRERVDGAARAGRVVARGCALCAPGLSGAGMVRGDAARLRHGAGVPAAGAPA